MRPQKSDFDNIRPPKASALTNNCILRVFSRPFGSSRFFVEDSILMILGSVAGCSKSLDSNIWPMQTGWNLKENLVLAQLENQRLGHWQKYVILRVDFSAELSSLKTWAQIWPIWTIETSNQTGFLPWFWICNFPIKNQGHFAEICHLHWRFNVV